MSGTESDSEEFCDAQEDVLLDNPTLMESNQSAEFFSHHVDKDQSVENDVEADGCEPSVKDDDPDEARLKLESSLTDAELEKGNDFFRNSDFTEALREYNEAIAICPIKYDKDRAILFSNRAACHSKLGDIDAALSDCDKALSLDPKYIRCLLRRAGLREEKERLSEALEDYQKLLELDPGNAKARFACMTLPDRIKKQQEEMKQKMMDQLKQLGNMVLKPFGLSTDNFQVQKNPDSEGYSINFVR